MLERYGYVRLRRYARVVNLRPMTLDLNGVNKHQASIEARKQFRARRHSPVCELCSTTSRDTCHTILWYHLSHRPPDSSAMGALWPAIRQGPLCSTQPAGRAARARDTRPRATRCGPESPSPPGQPAPAARRPEASSGHPKSGPLLIAVWSPGEPRGPANRSAAP